MLWNDTICRLLKYLLSPNNKITKTVWIRLSGWKNMRGKMKDLKKRMRNLLKGIKIIYLNKKLTVIFSVITIFNSNNWCILPIFWNLLWCYIENLINRCLNLPTTNVLEWIIFNRFWKWKQLHVINVWYKNFVFLS